MDVTRSEASPFCACIRVTKRSAASAYHRDAAFIVLGSSWSVSASTTRASYPRAHVGHGCIKQAIQTATGPDMLVMLHRRMRQAASIYVMTRQLSFACLRFAIAWPCMGGARAQLRPHLLDNDIKRFRHHAMSCLRRAGCTRHLACCRLRADLHQNLAGPSHPAPDA